MAGSRDNGWQDDYETYTESQVESVLDALDVEIVNDTATHFLALCPFHGNTDTPAFAVNKTNGKWICFNPSCELSGTLTQLVRQTRGLNPLRAELFIAKHKKEQTSFKIKEVVTPETFKEFSQATLDRLHQNFLESPKAWNYMHGRGFTDETLEYFQIGYSPARITQSGRYRPEMVTVPMHDYKGMPIGLIGRSISGEKQFKNSWQLPKRFTAWNIHRARKAGGSVVVTEASFDAMRVHQAGYPNVIALLGGAITSHHITQIERYFSKVIIMTDLDPKKFEENCRKCTGACIGHSPGRDLGNKIANGVHGKKIMWAAYDDRVIYPSGCKDVGDMTDDQIRQCLRNAVSHMQYRNWNID